MCAIFSLAMNGGRPIQFAKDHTAGSLQIQSGSSAQRNHAEIRFPFHESCNRFFLLRRALPPSDKNGAIRSKFLSINIHHRVMMGKQQHFFPAILQRTHKRRNKRCLCHAGRLPFAAPNLFFQQRALLCVRMQCQQTPS